VKKIAFHVESMRPACVLLQAALGCDPAVAHGFPVESWIIEGPEARELKVYPVTDEQLQILIKRVSARYSKGK
jgi:hypothetical protein